MNVLVQIANKMGLHKKLRHRRPTENTFPLLSLMDGCLATAAVYRLAPQYLQTGHNYISQIHILTIEDHFSVSLDVLPVLKLKQSLQISQFREEHLQF
jgi:hypothetical protein